MLQARPLVNPCGAYHHANTELAHEVRTRAHSYVPSPRSRSVSIDTAALLQSLQALRRPSTSNIPVVTVNGHTTVNGCVIGSSGEILPPIRIGLKTPIRPPSPRAELTPEIDQDESIFEGNVSPFPMLPLG
jgi:hypothetical protein